ncbi:MAG: hypothetical protein UW93_C0017G0002 [Parcubacteria group bacterium GW2011_GWC1_45_13]|uniref:Uncharacterized protein n=3 Tax=Parcubacteria group TaxID=1794811 RepID=A0A837IHC4_9BACT|nr:MAG: hypothetical protein UW49_C0020G0002 [Candidatus Giovannonibacteria bacterium GW2011_GWB1_44_23]KKT59157.1 MAG: hypothetical protein UW53_C0020G0002 [Candidatus Giovannonibacteria bacterium GW2011_GWA1_44_25]KKT90911.1 MAG: hypothetical protein UW93_C0017G0002 [Parcubacteria group bacterium GW2011_GWC1_45_13]KKU12965.1 MAG: hypothetical protein UX18_C0005G0009 [Candidatus Azambacteria bacterium GW2011_GWC2_45_7b]
MLMINHYSTSLSNIQCLTIALSRVVKGTTSKSARFLWRSKKMSKNKWAPVGAHFVLNRLLSSVALCFRRAVGTCLV